DIVKFLHDLVFMQSDAVRLRVDPFCHQRTIASPAAHDNHFVPRGDAADEGQADELQLRFRSPANALPIDDNVAALLPFKVTAEGFPLLARIDRQVRRPFAAHRNADVWRWIRAGMETGAFRWRQLGDGTTDICRALAPNRIRESNQPPVAFGGDAVHAHASL